MRKKKKIEQTHHLQICIFMSGIDQHTLKCQHLDLNRVDTDVEAVLELFHLVLTKLSHATLAQDRRVFAMSSISCRKHYCHPFPITSLLQKL